MKTSKPAAPQLTSRVSMSAADVERTIVAELARRGYVVQTGTRPEVLRGDGTRAVVGAAFDTIVATVLVEPVRPKRRARGFAELRVMQTLVVVGLVSAVVIGLVNGFTLTTADDARSDRDFAEARDDRCRNEWAKTIARASFLRGELRAALDAEEGAVCTCWIPDDADAAVGMTRGAP